jgi:hypothetical protein
LEGEKGDRRIDALRKEGTCDCTPLPCITLTRHLPSLPLSLFTFQGEAVDIETAKQKEDTVGGIVVGMDQQTLQE